MAMIRESPSGPHKVSLIMRDFSQVKFMYKVYSDVGHPARNCVSKALMQLQNCVSRHKSIVNAKMMGFSSNSSTSGSCRISKREEICFFFFL